MSTKKYVSLDKLSLYDEKIKKFLADADAAVLAESKSFAEGLGSNYEQAGTVATAQAALQKNIDAVQANVDTVSAANVATQKEVDALETLVGTLPEGTAATSVVDYVNVKTAGIATDAALGELNNQVSGLQTVVNGISADYLKSADKQELVDAIAAEETRAKGVESGLETRLKAVEDDYLKAADAETLQGNIDAVAEDVAEIAEDYLKAADKTELSGLVTAEADRAKGIEAGLRTDVDAIKGDYLKATDKTELSNAIAAEKERAEGVEAGLQTQINTIMNNPDTEGVINSINEFTQYIADHGEIADGFRTDIDANKKAIEDHEALAAQTYETKEDATSKYDELAALVGEKAIQADWNQNDESAADYVKNRTHYEGVEYEFVSEHTVTTNNEVSEGVYKSEYDTSIAPYSGDGKYIRVVFDGVTYDNVYCASGCCGNPNLYDGNEYKKETMQNPEVPFAFSFESQGWGYYYATTAGEHTVEFYKETSTVKQLDEKFIPDSIARATDVDALKNELEGKINAKADASALTSAVEALEAADDGIIERVAAVEALMGDGEGSVADQIADAKAETLEEAAAVADEKDAEILAQAKTDASNKDAVVLSEAQKGIDAVQAALDTHTGNGDIHVTAEQKTAWTTAAGKAHEHSNFEVLEGITAAKVTAWDAAEGNAKAHANGLNTAMDTRVLALETWHANFVEVSEEEINGLFA